METFQDLWYKMNEQVKYFELFGHNFIYCFIKQPTVYHTYYVCNNCQTSLHRVFKSLAYDSSISVYNISDKNDSGAYHMLGRLLDKNLLTCDEMTIKSIIE